MGMKWARDPLSRIAPMQLSYQQLYAQLEASIQQFKDEKAIILSDRVNYNLDTCNHVTNTSDEITEKHVVPGVLFSGQGRYGVNPKSTSKRACFNCGMTHHLIKDCRKRINFKSMAPRKLASTEDRFGNTNAVMLEVVRRKCNLKMETSC